MKLLVAVLVLAAGSTADAQSADTVFADVGSPAIDARLFQPHAARVRVYRGDTLVSQWTNELSLGDSAGRRVMRWITTGEPVPANPNRPLGVLRQTYDAVTLPNLATRTSSVPEHSVISGSMGGESAGPDAPPATRPCTGSTSHSISRAISRARLT